MLKKTKPQTQYPSTKAEGKKALPLTPDVYDLMNGYLLTNFMYGTLYLNMLKHPFSLLWVWSFI